MNKVNLVICVSFCCFYLFACVSNTESKQKVIRKPETNNDTAIVLDSTVKISTIEHVKYILLDTMKFHVPVEDSINSANIYKGILDYKSKSLERRSFLITKNLAYFTTFESVGTGYRAYLYVFDLASRSLIKDSAFKHDFLFSSAGIFVIDPDNNRIFAVDKYAWYDEKGALIVPAGLYTASGGYFKDIKSVYIFGGEIPSDTAVLTYFKNSISPASKGVYKLPHDWWKMKSH